MDMDQKRALGVRSGPHSSACSAVFKGEPVTSAPLAARLSIPSGPLFFPVTAYGTDGSVALDVYRTHVRDGVEAGAAAVFACCGTGEFHALAPEEFEACVRAAVEAADGRVPVVAGAGYGTALAV